MADNKPPQHEDLDAIAKILYLSQGIVADGQPFYAYLSVTPSNYERLQEAETTGNFNLKDYGDIIGYEIGVKEPSQHIKAKVAEIFELNASGDSGEDSSEETLKQTFLEILADDT